MGNEVNKLKLIRKELRNQWFLTHLAMTAMYEIDWLV
jgi:hypothetical protein